jgi:hypothetical protein
MNAKLLTINLLLFLTPLIGFSQLKNAYFLLDKSSQDYVISTSIGEFSEDNLNKIDLFYLCYRNQYEKVQKEIEVMKKNGTYYSDGEGGSNAPHLISFDFGVLSRKTRIIPINEFNLLNLVDFDWLQKNSWKPNNKNIVFKDLYFLYETQKDKYIIYKVYRTQVVY